MKNYKGRHIQVEHQCPQCGAPVILTENDRLFSCNFCRVRLYILSKDYFRYYLSPSASSPENVIFIPYWRFRGIYYSLKPFTVKSRVVDTSFRASNHTFLPDSLGLRTQTLKLRFATGKVEGRFLCPQLSLEDVLSTVEKISRTTDNLTNTDQPFHTAFIGETLSLIYTPIYFEGNAIYDGILNRPLARLSTIRTDMFETVDDRKNWTLQFMSSLCPNCGWDLAGERESIVLICENCCTAQQITKGSFKEITFGIFPSKDANAIYFPFWKMKAKIKGLQAHSYADLIRIANLPKMVQAEWEKKDLYFWSPAFKTIPRLFMRLSKQVTLCQPSSERCESNKKLSTYPITLNVGEAFESIKVSIANISASKRKIFPELSHTDITPELSSLVFLPLTLKGGEFINTDMHISIPQKAV